MECAVRIFDASLATLWPAHQVHDELIYIVPEDMGDQVGKMVAAEFSKSPTWLPDAPLGAEHHIGPSYGEAK
jgi:DNA polymerase I-like protein with 3'-5' exonuclease and polymerase domains